LLLLLIFSVFGCSVDNGIVKRIGGDITGFLSENGTYRIYSSSDDYRLLEIRRDTIIDDIALKLVVFNSEERYFSYSDSWIYERIDLGGAYFDIPFMPSVLVEGAIFSKSDIGPDYSYDYYCIVDSLSAIQFEETLINNAYFVTVSRSFSAGGAEFEDNSKFALSNAEGIVGIYEKGIWFFLDSIIY